MKRTRREGGHLIAQIHQISGRILAKKLREREIDAINPAQGRILFALWSEDGISIQQLAERTRLAKSTLSAMLDRLESAGHVRRVHSSEDRRQILVETTARDRALRDIYDEVSREMTALFYAGFRAAEIDRFETDLRRILGNLVAHRAD